MAVLWAGPGSWRDSSVAFRIYGYLSSDYWPSEFIQSQFQRDKTKSQESEVSMKVET
jgi:hypothetical protein